MKYALFIVPFLWIISTANAAPCEGDACSAISVEWDGQCYHVKNHSRIKAIRFSIVPGNVKSMSFDLGPGNSEVLEIWGQCFKSYTPPYKANYL